MISPPHWPPWHLVPEPLIERMIKPQWRIWVYIGIGVLIAGMALQTWLSSRQKTQPTTDPRDIYRELERRFR